MKNLSLRSEIKRKSYLKIYSLFEYLLFDHFATMGAERRLGALPPATRSGRPQWMPTHARAVIMVSSFRFQAGGDACVPGQRSRTATRTMILVSSFKFQAPMGRGVPGQRTDSHSDSDFGFRFQVSSPDRSGRTRTLPRPQPPLRPDLFPTSRDKPG